MMVNQTEKRDGDDESEERDDDDESNREKRR